MSREGYEPSEEEIYGKLVKEIQSKWTEKEWLQRARQGTDKPGIRVVDTKKLQSPPPEVPDV